MITPELLRAIVAQYQGDRDGVHGLAHWARVLENGERLARGLDVDRRVIALFAVFHDACRLNDGIDPGHGARAAELAREFRDRHFELDRAALDLLVRACEEHTDGQVEGPLTVRVCWDADRLDLLRCAIRPRPEKLATDVARQPGVIAWASSRAADDRETELLRTRWRPWLAGDGVA